MQKIPVGADHVPSLDSPHFRLLVEAERFATVGDAVSALQAVHAARRLEPTSEDSLVRLANVSAHCGDFIGAASLYEDAVTRYPGSARAHAGCGQISRILGASEEAERAFDRALKLDPHDCESQFLRSSLRRQTPAQNHIPELIAILSQGVRDWRDATKIAFSLGKEFDDVGDHEGAALHWERGNRIKRQHTRYDVEDDIRMIDAIIAAFSEEACRSAPPAPSGDRRPLFIVGLPRTGSTLVERILSCHRDVESAGELDAFTGAVTTEVAKLAWTSPRDRLALPQRTLEIDPGTLAEAYRDMTAPLGRRARRLIDKMPLNFLNLGLIHRAFPNCGIVHVARRPLDTCFAIYRHLFKDAYPFSYDLGEVGRYYAAYHRLMDHWRAVLPGRVIEVQYEALVQDQEAETRRLVEALGLPWDPACLRPQDNASPSTTASASQVRRPIYSSSIDVWKPYARHLEPLVRMLEREGVPLA